MKFFVTKWDYKQADFIPEREVTVTELRLLARELAEQGIDLLINTELSCGVALYFDPVEIY